MIGISVSTGARLSRAAHIRQSVADILTTPIGSRVMRRAYGSRIFDLVDSPGNETGALRMVAAAADALARWEPRIRVTSAALSVAADGSAVMAVDAVDLGDGSELTAAATIGRAS